MIRRRSSSRLLPCAPEARYSNKVAHGEQSTATVLTADQPGLLFDYYGFPAESYHYDYPCPGSPKVAEWVIEHLRAAGIGCEPDAQRGLDHGAFVPLMLMYPQAQVPCLQLSLLDSLDAAAHIKLGSALQSLRSWGVMILESGSPFHNMNALRDVKVGRQAGREFNRWLLETYCNRPPEEAAGRLVNWQDAPSARYAHPREEHLLPLHVCLGAALSAATPAKCAFNAEVMGYQMSAFLWD